VSKEPGVWGLTRKKDLAHYFRKRKALNGNLADMTIHPTSKGRGHAYLFVPRPDWDPTHPLTCKDCLELLEFEKECEGMEPPKRPVS